MPRYRQVESRSVCVFEYLARDIGYSSRQFCVPRDARYSSLIRFSHQIPRV